MHNEHGLLVWPGDIATERAPAGEGVMNRPEGTPDTAALGQPPPALGLAYVAGSLGGLWLVLTVARSVLVRRFGRPPRRKFDPSLVPSDAVDVQIPTGTGATLRGWLRRPADADEDGEPGPAALLMHGWGASAVDMVPLSQPLLAAGLRVLLVDARGHGRSDDVDVASMPSFAEDVRAALRWLRRQPEIASGRIVLVGHSVGAGAVLFVAAEDDALAGVVSLSSMAAPREFMEEHMRGRLPGPLIWPALRCVEHLIGHRFTEFSPIYTIGRSTMPVLLVHGALDTTVAPRDAERLHAQTAGRSTLLVLPDAGHAGVGSIEEGAVTLLRFLGEAGVLPGG